MAPLQLDIVTPVSGKAACRAARSFVIDMIKNKIFIKPDFANAFDTMRRDVMLQVVHNTIPEFHFGEF